MVPPTFSQCTQSYKRSPGSRRWDPSGMLSYTLLSHLATHGKDLSILSPPAWGIPVVILSGDCPWVSAGSGPGSAVSSDFLLPLPLPAGPRPGEPPQLLPVPAPPACAPPPTGQPPEEGSAGEVLLSFIAHLSIFQTSTSHGSVSLTDFSKGLKVRNNLEGEKKQRNTKLKICH